LLAWACDPASGVPRVNAAFGEKRKHVKPDGEDAMDKKLTMVYWQGEKFWLGKFIEYPEIMTQGETVEELEENLRDAYSMMVMEDVPEGYLTKEISV
jgi:predicted RNase H-like HicB family nuclease